MQKYINTWLIAYMSIVLTAGIATNVVIAKNQTHPKQHVHQARKPWTGIAHRHFKIFLPTQIGSLNVAAAKPQATTARVNHTWRYIRVLATAYLIVNNQDDPNGRCPVYNNLTASGTHVQLGVVAVDTGVFPFGTHFSIPGYGTGRARDTGGFINGRHIDLAMISCKKAHEWGAKHVMVAYEPPQRN